MWNAAMRDLGTTGTLVALALCGALTLINLAGIAMAARRIGRGQSIGLVPAGAPVSLVRPVCGIEAFSEELLTRGFQLAYADYEILFCVADADDPIVPLLRRLMPRIRGSPPA